jgi:SAM-dependent methyltransferase
LPTQINGLTKPGMNNYLSGNKIYGDNFTIEQLEQWYEAEKEGYANLGNKVENNYSYQYHLVNKMFGFKYLPKNKTFQNALGIGSAYGDEFIPIASKIENLFILEPSDYLVSKKVGNLTPKYVKPEVSGKLNFEDNTFDLITCFGSLHHIANVSYVIGELSRVLKPGGYLLLREPIVSMGDWNHPRPWLTKNERGFPIKILMEIVKKSGFKVVSKKRIYTATFFLIRKLGRLIKKPLYTYTWYLYFDKLASLLTRWNYHYHPTKFWQRIAPQNVFLVLKKSDN